MEAEIYRVKKSSRVAFRVVRHGWPHAPAGGGS